MAKLSANGRVEVARWMYDTDTPDSDSTTWNRTTLALMSDGNLLQKYDCRFKPDTFSPDGRYHSYGWKKYRRMKKDADLDKVVQDLDESLVRRRLWTRVK